MNNGISNGYRHRNPFHGSCLSDTLQKLLKIILGTGLLSHGAHLLTPDDGRPWRHFPACLG